VSVNSRFRDSEYETPVLGYGSYHSRSRSGADLTKPFRYVFGFFDGAEWLRLILVSITLGIALYSVQQAKWISNQPPLVLVLIASIFVTAIVTRLAIPRAVKLGLIAASGIGMLVWQTIRTAGRESVVSSLSAAPNESTVHFAVFLLLLAWIAGAFSAWYLLRKKNAWIPAGIGAAIVLVNLSNLPQEHYGILPVYFVAALVFIGLNHLQTQREWFERNSARGARGSGWFVTSVLGLSLMAMIAAMVAPQGSIDRVGFDASGKLVNSLERDWFNVFASVPGKWTIMRSTDLKTLLFSSPLDNRDTVLFSVTSSQPSYWRINRYDQYNSWGWTSSVVDDESIHAPSAETAPSGLTGIKKLTYSVENRSKTDVILLAGEFISTTVPVKMARPVLGGVDPDVLTVVAPELLQPRQRYTAVVGISSATVTELSRAGAVYPAWVTQRYLQIPSGLSPRVRQTTSTIASGKTNVYERATAVLEYLRALKYNRDAKSPSRNGDEVSSFLFVQKEGVCTDFATAMVIMLRTAGIPARLATGYLPGQHEAGTDQYLVRGKDYHAWAEVYFPNYGWISFDPTPVQGADTTPDIIGPTGSSADANPDEFLFPDAGSPPGDISLPAATRNNVALPIIVFTLIGGSVIGLLWTFGRRMLANLRRSSSASAVYAKMCRFADALRLGPGMTETPLEYGRRLAAALPEGSEYIDSVARLYTECRFSPRKDLEGEDLERLQKAWNGLYPILFKRRLPWKR
jgi:transglutaminase-like putative cysteine protease